MITGIYCNPLCARPWVWTQKTQIEGYRECYWQALQMWEDSGNIYVCTFFLLKKITWKHSTYGRIIKIKTFTIWKSQLQNNSDCSLLSLNTDSPITQAGMTHSTWLSSAMALLVSSLALGHESQLGYNASQLYFEKPIIAVLFSPGIAAEENSWDQPNFCSLESFIFLLECFYSFYLSLYLREKIASI